MKSVLINMAGKLGGYQLARLLTAGQPKILMYHRFTSEKSEHSVCEKTFEEQIQLIKRYFTPMTLSGLASCINGQGEIPKHAIVITVDDGYRDFYEVAYPLLKHYGIPATFFVTTGFINRDLWLWPDQVAWLLRNQRNSKSSIVIGDRTIDVGGPYHTTWGAIVNQFLSVSNEERLQGLIDLATACGVSLPTLAPEVYSASNWKQLEEMQESGIEIGGHTVSHPSLGHMKEQDAEWEIGQSWKMLAASLGDQERSFCFPNGQPEDYSNAIKKLVASSRYTASVTAFSDMYNVSIPYAWRRFVGCEDSFQFHKSLFGVEHLGNTLRKTTRCGY